MNRLSFQKILEDNQTRDSASITSLTLHQRALSDVSCLNEFKNLEKLDLSFNNLSSLEGLKTCINLKWLSVVQNKLISLRGIESLVKLTVFNAGKNKLKSMDEVRSLVSLKALILNDNEITSVCKLNQLKDLNTLVLSRNPICDIGDSLAKLKSITKLSLSNCQLQTVGSSLSSLVNMKEIRLAHNEISSLPAELVHNIRLQNLDLGNNFITRKSDLKILSSLHNLRNLNLQGNPIAENDKLGEKIKKLLPDLRIFNTKPIERSKKHESLKKDAGSHMKISGKRGLSQNEDSPAGMDNKIHQKKFKIDEVSDIDGSRGWKDGIVRKDKSKMIKETKGEEGKLDPIDNGEISFMELFSEKAGNAKKKTKEAGGRDSKSFGGIVTYPTESKKGSKSVAVGGSALQLLSSGTEVGMGGPSTWDA